MCCVFGLCWQGKRRGMNFHHPGMVGIFLRAIGTLAADWNEPWKTTMPSIMKSMGIDYCVSWIDRTALTLLWKSQCQNWRQRWRGLRWPPDKADEDSVDHLVKMIVALISVDETLIFCKHCYWETKSIWPAWNCCCIWRFFTSAPRPRQECSPPVTSLAYNWWLLHTRFSR